MKKKKKKLKKRGLLVLFIIFIILLFVLYLLFNRVTLNKIKTNYSKYVVVIHDTDIYDKNNNKIGTISKDIKLQLKKDKKVDLDTKYFEVLDGSFYIYYKDIKPIKNKNNIKNNYLVFNKNIEKDKVNLLKRGKTILSLSKKMSFPILYMDDKYYYVNYYNNILQIKKEKKDKVIDSNNTNKEESSYVSVIDYEIGDCEKCISKDTVIKQLKYIKNNNYNILSVDEYKQWIKGNIRLVGKNILLTTDSNSIKDLSYKINKTNIKFNNVNKPSKDGEYNRYLITNNTSDEVFKQMLDGMEIYDKKASKIAVLNYHFFYDSSIGESCGETICLDTKKFREHLDYLKENNFKTLTMKEFRDWIYGKIDLPEKSVLITVDDGAMGTGKHNGNKLIPLLEEYKMHATLFLIAGWWDIENYRSKYLDIQSHTYDMHLYGDCKKGQLVCASYEEAKKDLEKSISIIKDKTSFCYPFYSYSDTSIKAVKDAGFDIAFAGGNTKATRNSNKYIIPRYPILSSITLSEFKNIVN